MMAELPQDCEQDRHGCADKWCVFSNLSDLLLRPEVWLPFSQSSILSSLIVSFSFCSRCRNFSCLCFSLRCSFAWSWWFRHFRLFWFWGSFWFWRSFRLCSSTGGRILNHCCRVSGCLSGGFWFWIRWIPFLNIIFITVWNDNWPDGKLGTKSIWSYSHMFA